ncbi:hypothetical protein AAVH_21281, partial [Aphelenchoides avenae]
TKCTRRWFVCRLWSVAFSSFVIHIIMMVRFGYSGTLFLFDMTIITVTLTRFFSHDSIKCRIKRLQSARSLPQPDKEDEWYKNLAKHVAVPRRRL